MRKRGYLATAAFGLALAAFFQYVDLRAQALVLTWGLVILALVLWDIIGSAGGLKAQVQELRERLTALGERLAALQVDVSYKFEINVIPDWERIIMLVAELDGSTAQTVREEMRSLQESSGRQLFQSYRFVIFHDGVSGVETIWSERDRTFVSTPQVEVYLNLQSVGRQGVGRYIAPSLFITPTSIQLLGWEVEHEDKPLGAIPVSDIRRLLVNISKHYPRGACRAIKTFPPRIKEALDQLGASYQEPNGSGGVMPDKVSDAYPNSTDWARRIGVVLYDDRVVDSHRFSTRGHKVELRLETFHPDDHSTPDF